MSNRYFAISELPGKSNRLWNRGNSFPRMVNENRRGRGKSREMYSTKIRVPWIVKDGTGWKLRGAGLAEFEPSKTYPITREFPRRKRGIEKEESAFRSGERMLLQGIGSTCRIYTKRGDANSSDNLPPPPPPDSGTHQGHVFSKRKHE